MSRWLNRIVLRGEVVSISRDTRRLMQLMADGYRNKQIAWELGVTEQTIKRVLNKIYRHYRVRNRTSLIVKAAKLGIVTYSKSEDVSCQ